MGLVPVGGTVVTLPQLAGAFQLVAGAVTSRNLLFQVEEVTMFCTSGKEMGAPTGNRLYDSAREITEMASMQFAVYGLMNPYTYQRPKITQLPNETSLTVPGGGSSIGGGTGSKFQDVFDLADNYNLSDDTFNNHILDRHGSNSAYGNKSHFNTDFDIREGIDSTLKGENFVEIGRAHV